MNERKEGRKKERQELSTMARPRRRLLFLTGLALLALLALSLGVRAQVKKEKKGNDTSFFFLSFLPSVDRLLSIASGSKTAGALSLSLSHLSSSCRSFRGSRMSRPDDENTKIVTKNRTRERSPSSRFGFCFFLSSSSSSSKSI